MNPIYGPNFIGPRLPYVRRKLKPVKPARRAKRIKSHIAAGAIEQRKSRAISHGLDKAREPK